jgi:hypothetical protein
MTTVSVNGLERVNEDVDESHDLCASPAMNILFEMSLHFIVVCSFKTRIFTLFSLMHPTAHTFKS